MEMERINFNTMKADELRGWVKDNNQELPLYDIDDLDFLDTLNNEELLEICIDIYNYKISQNLERQMIKDKKLTPEQEEVMLEAGRKNDYEAKK